MRPWKLAETNYGVVKENAYEVAVLPFGATEPHNLHLPYATDTLESEVIGDRICQAAHEAGAKVVLLPTVPYGTQTNQRELPLAMNLNPSTLTAVIGDLVESLAGSGIRKIVLLNCHGGNDFKPVLRELHDKCDAKLFLINFYTVLSDVYHEIFDERDDHAGEMETSIALAYFPELVVHKDDGSLAADEGAAASTRFDAVNQGWVSITRPWHLLTTNTGVGNPHAATAEKGRQFIDQLNERLAGFLVELSQCEINERFPY